MEKKPYRQLIFRYQNWVFNLPETEDLHLMLEGRFTMEETAFLATMPFMPHSLTELAERLETTAEELKLRMEPLLKKGVIYEVEGRSAVRYSLSDQLFAFYRMPGWKGEDNALNRSLFPLANRYYTEHFVHDFMGHPTKGLRAIPIAGTIVDTRQIIPYEDLLAYVEREGYHTVSTCACRHRNNLDPSRDVCDHETMNCLHFGRLGRYIVKHGMGKEITRQETLEILKSAADAGLVHGISNTRKGMDTICNCCSCCCLFLENVRIDTGMPAGHQRSNYRLETNRETCKACGLCERRCPVGAIRLTDKVDPPPPEAGRKPKPADLREVDYDTGKCIGCGVCAHKCPTQGLALVRRDGPEEDIPETMREQGERMIMERERDFSQIF